jgi:hypothetical protein
MQNVKGLFSTTLPGGPAHRAAPAERGRNSGGRNGLAPDAALAVELAPTTRRASHAKQRPAGALDLADARPVADRVKRAGAGNRQQ